MEHHGAIARETMDILRGLNWGDLTYDEAFKLIFSEKTVLALILRDCIGGYDGMTLEEIAGCITSDPQASSVPIGPGQTNAGGSPLRVRGGATEETVPYEGRSTFDFYFEAMMPEGGNLVGINVDVEGEASYTGAGYAMANRAQFYCARLISSQCERAFTHGEYDSIKPVYSVWVFVSCPDELRGKIIATKTSWVSLDGGDEVPPDPRSLSTIVFAFLDKDASGAGRPDIIGVLETLLSRKMPWREKCSIIEATTGIEIAPRLEAGSMVLSELDEGMHRIYQELFREEGFKAGQAEGRAAGWREGHEEGKAEGLEKGLAEGLEKGLAEGLERGLAEGREKGRAEGCAEGRAEGHAKGHAEGRAEGRLESLVELTRNAMGNLGIDVYGALDVLGIPECDRAVVLDEIGDSRGD